MFTIGTILAIAISTYCVSIFLCRNKKVMKTRNPPLPPGPSPWPIIGCLPQMLKARNKYKWIFGLMKDFNTDILCIRIGKVHVIPVTSPKIASGFLKEQDAVFASRPRSMAAALVSHEYKGIVLSPSGKQWMKIRKILTSELFSPAMHKWFHDKRVEEADNIVSYVYNIPNGVVDFRKTTLCYSTNMIRRLIFNKRYFGEARPDNGPGAMEEEHSESVLETLRHIFSFAVSDYFPLFTGLDFDGKETKAIEANKALEKYQNPIIEERIRKWRFGSDSPNDAPKDDMLDIMINLKDSDGKPLLSEEEIKACVNELVIGATDNSSNAVEWAMAEMFNQPSIMQKAVEEIDIVVGKERLVQECDIPNLKYIKAILIEAFRLHPIQPFIPPHLATSDTTMAGYFIPKGSHILISRYGVGRNPETWEDPLVFNPERHVESGAVLRSVITDPSLGFITFGVGRRSCVAASLGTSMTVMLLARLLQAFEWKLPEGRTKVNLEECEDELFLAEPLVACATPRLPPHLYRF